MSEDSDLDPMETLERADDHKATSMQHSERAKELSKKAEDKLKEKIEKELPDATVTVDSEYNYGSPAFSVEVEDDRISDAVKSAAGEELDCASIEAQQFFVGKRNFDHSEREMVESVTSLIAELEDEYEKGAPIEAVMDEAPFMGMTPKAMKHEIQQLKQKGEVYEPRTDFLRTT
ncbi:hypothetical protein [Haloarcula amylovorans]|uniref:hypothetical protein n=1 Tax=Haloarcula amylovorans TaxID=2562280 RepID=UPI0010766584|nr:hypothetical protein [Halomicroarcula amylolytica]